MPSTVTHCHALSRRVLRCFAHDRLTLIRVCGSRQRKLRWRTTCLDQLCLRWTEAGRADRICMDLHCALTGPLGSAHWVTGGWFVVTNLVLGHGLLAADALWYNRVPQALQTKHHMQHFVAWGMPILTLQWIFQSRTSHCFASHRVASLRTTG